ncbi:MAG: hypothetical protein AAFU60_05940 [Bacteroidota bacterium]
MPYEIMEALPDTSRVWIYQSNRIFTEAETQRLKVILQQFAEQWTSHNRALRANASLLHDRFIVLLVDESMAGASGCSIDKSVHFMQAIEQEFGVQLFDRMNFAYQQGSEIRTANRDEFVSLYAQGIITDETIVFDNLVKTKGELSSGWQKPLAESWHARMV